MVVTKSSEPATVGQSQKSYLNSDCGLQLAHMKSELLVMANQHVAVNAFPGLVHTARQAMGVGSTQRLCANLHWRQQAKVKPMTRVKA